MLRKAVPAMPGQTGLDRKTAQASTGLAAPLFLVLDFRSAL
jgi:hypothetical protein